MGVPIGVVNTKSLGIYNSPLDNLSLFWVSLNCFSLNIIFYLILLGIDTVLILVSVLDGCMIVVYLPSPLLLNVVSCLMLLFTDTILCSKLISLHIKASISPNLNPVPKANKNKHCNLWAFQVGIKRFCLSIVYYIFLFGLLRKV